MRVGNPTSAPPQNGFGVGLPFSAFMKDAFRRNIGRRTINIPADEQICHIIVKPSRIELAMPLMFAYIPAIIGIELFCLSFFDYYTLWWVWVVLAGACVLPLALLKYLTQFMGFRTWIFTDKALHQINFGRQIGANLNPPAAVGKYADLKLTCWDLMSPAKIKEDKGYVGLCTDYKTIVTGSYNLQVSRGLAPFQRMLVSLLRPIRPPQVILAEYLHALRVPYNPDMREYNTSKQLVSKVHVKRVLVAVLTPVIAGIITLLTWYLSSLWSYMSILIIVYGILFVAMVIGIGIDLTRRTRHFANFGVRSIRITPSGVKVIDTNNEVVEDHPFTPDWLVALANPLVTYKFTWETMSTVEIYDLAHPAMPFKLGLLAEPEAKQFYFSLLEAYYAWLDEHVPGYFLAPAEVRNAFIAADPFNAEVLTLIEARVQAYRQDMVAAQAGLRPLPPVTPVPLPPVHLEASAERVVSSEIPVPPGTPPLKYPIISYTPYFADGENMLYVYHPAHPARALATKENIIFGIIFVVAIIAINVWKTMDLYEGLFEIFSLLIPLAVGMLWFCGALFPAIGEYFTQRYLELVLTTRNIYYQLRGTIKVIPFANLQEVTRIRLNRRTGEYLKIRFVFKNTVAQFPTVVPNVPRSSPLFGVLSQQGVALPEE